MRLFCLATAVMGAACLGDGSSAQAQYMPKGGFGYGPSLGGWNQQYMVPGYPYFGNGRPSNSSYYNRGSASNYARSNFGGGRTQAVVVNPTVAKPVGDGQPIKILNPKDSGSELHYRLNGSEYAIKPGESQLLVNDRKWVLSFDRGGDFGTAEYSLSGGQYWFELTDDHGWEAFHDSDVSKLKSSTPTPSTKNPLPK
jgi:hypothetical protein